MFARAVDTLRNRYDERNRNVHFQLFEAYDLSDEPNEQLSYSVLADRFNLDSVTVNNYLAATRRDFRKIVLELLRAVTATDEEFRSESRSLLGIGPL